MRLNVFKLALCVYIFQVRSASIKAPEKLDHLYSVDFDAEPVLIEQPSVVDIDNIVVENSNHYVPNKDDSIKIKRMEIDLSDPGLPQRQVLEIQNPESYGVNEQAIYAIKQSILDTQNIFNTGLKSVSNSLKTLFAANEDLPAIQQKIQNISQTFEGQIEKLNVTIRSHFKEQTMPSEEVAIDPDLKIVSSELRNLENNFRSGVDSLSEGVEIGSILREETEAARAEATPEEAATPGSSASQPAYPLPTVPNPSQITQPVMSFLNVFQKGIINAIDNLNYVIHIYFSRYPLGAIPPPQSGNPIITLIQGITGLNNGQPQNPTDQATAREAQPTGAQGDPVALPALIPAPTPAPLHSLSTSPKTTATLM